MSVSAIEFLLARNRPEEAERLAREAIAKDPQDPGLLLLLAASLFDQSKPKLAEEVIRDIIAIEPDFDSAYFMLARCLTERSRNKEALKAIDTAIAIDPDDATYHGIRASILAELNKEAEALKATETGLALDADNDTCRFFRSILLSKVGRHDEAGHEASALLADDPDDATSHCARGWVAHLAGDAQTAEQHFIEALQIDPGHEDAKIGLAEALRMGNPLLGWFMRGLLWMGRVPWYYLVTGILVATVIGRFLRKVEDPTAMMLGKGLQGLLMSLFVLILVNVPLFNLALASSRKGRLALSEDEKTGLKWTTAPLLLGIAFLIMWWSSGLVSLPFVAMACLSATSLIAEVMESPRTQVRRPMALIASVATAIAAYIILFRYFWFPDMAVTLLENAAVAVKNEGAKKTKELADALLEILVLRRNYIDYPTLFIFFVASFRDDIRQFFERRASDTVS